MRSTSFAIIMLLAFGVAGCPDDDGDNDVGDVLDSGMLDSGLNAPRDAATNKSDARDTANAACHSWTKPAEPMCGGTHCLQNFEQLTASVMAGSVCGGENDLKSLCSLAGPEALGECSLINVSNRDQVRPCAEKKLGSAVSSACMDCYMKSADCAFENCVIDCLNGTNTVRCDKCRLNQGCAKIFYDCAGIANPPTDP